MEIIPAIDVKGGRSRLVYWPGAASGTGAPTDRPDRIAEQLVAQGARSIHLVDFDGALRGAPAILEVIGAVAARVAVPLQVAGGLGDATTSGSPSRPARRAPCSPPPSWSGPTTCGRASPWPATGWPSGLDPRPDRIAAYPWNRTDPPTLDTLVEELVAAGVHRVVLSHGGAAPDTSLLDSLIRRHDVDVLVAGGVNDLAGIRRLRDAGVAGCILGEAILSGAIDLPAALEAATA